jgi:hypothetical protein
MSEPTPGPPPFLEPPEPPRPFVGRDGDVKRLTELLESRPFRHGFEPVVITGEPGIGKTAFAAAFCYLSSATPECSPSGRGRGGAFFNQVTPVAPPAEKR